MAAQLTRRATIATFLWLADDKAIFSYGDEDRPFFHYETRADWEDMGSPTSLTLTVEPGDLLNDG